MKRLLLISLFLAGLSFVGMGWAKPLPQEQSEPSLGDMAREQKAKKGQTANPGKVYTNDEVKNPLSISLPDKTWAVEIHAEGFTLTADDSAPGGKRRIMAIDEARGITISVQLEQVNHEPTLDECRQSQRDRVKAFTGKLQMRDIKYGDDGKMAFVEYFVPEYEGRPVRQNNLFACFSKENVFVDVHVSKIPFEPKDEEMLSAVMGTVYVAEKDAGSGSTSGPNSMELFRQGSLLYNKGRFRESIEPYQKALDLEKKDPKLERFFWRVLVDNLGMAYGITGDLNKAKETFDYGVSQDKTYPLFYYNLACTYAEMQDLDKAIANLKTAFENKQNGIPGERMPDPRRDDSFQRFMQNKKFRDLVDSLAGSSR
jgi:hypothetical protein